MNRTRKSLAAAAVAGSMMAGGVAGLLMFGGNAANAADGTGSTTTPAAVTAPTDTARPVRTPQTALTGDDLAKVTAAVLAAEPDATIVRAEGDGNGIHVHITKADGTTARVVLNSDFTVKSVDADMGKGGGAPSGPHQANGITETPLAGDDLSKATAAAATAEPGSTVVRAETDADGDSFEVHITKADGTRATVKLNSDFSVKTVEADQGGRGGNGGHGHGGPRGGQAPADAPASDATTATTTA